MVRFNESQGATRRYVGAHDEAASKRAVETPVRGAGPGDDFAFVDVRDYPDNQKVRGHIEALKTKAYHEIPGHLDDLITLLQNREPISHDQLEDLKRHARDVDEKTNDGIVNGFLKWANSGYKADAEAIKQKFSQLLEHIGAYQKAVETQGALDAHVREQARLQRELDVERLSPRSLPPAPDVGEAVGVSEAQGKLEAALERQQDLSSRLETAESNLGKLEKQNSKLETSYQALQEEHDRLLAQLAQAKTESPRREETSGIDPQLVELSEKLEHQQASMQAVQQFLREEKERVRELSAQNSALDNEIAGLRRGSIGQEKEIGRLRSELDHTRMELTATEADSLAVAKENEVLKQQMKELQAQHEQELEQQRTDLTQTFISGLKDGLTDEQFAQVMKALAGKV